MISIGYDNLQCKITILGADIQFQVSFLKLSWHNWEIMVHYCYGHYKKYDKAFETKRVLFLKIIFSYIFQRTLLLLSYKAFLVSFVSCSIIKHSELKRTSFSKPISGNWKPFIKKKKNAFSFMLNALFVRRVLKFLCWFFEHVGKRFDKNAKVSFKTYDVTD